MSRETSDWLNTNTLIGFTDQRGTAWHYRAERQGARSNHYPGAIPVEDVRQRLFDWRAVEGDVRSTVSLADGTELLVTDPSRKAIIRPDTGTILGIFRRKSYKVHQFDTWLIDEVANLLDDDLAIGSAGRLKGGAVAWVSIEVPETITTPEGVAFRPHLLAAASHDGSLSTTFTRTVTNTVCDNTMSVALAEGAVHGQRLKVRHTRHSLGRLTEAREALGIIHTIADDFAAQVAQLTSIKVSEGDWNRFLGSLAPVPERPGRTRTIAEQKREALHRLYRDDERSAPWVGTAWGVLQAVNTMVHHETPVRGAERADRNAERAIRGGIDKIDRSTLMRLTALVS
jgi:phage/plasmid-like protein (TIGR03299 family)